MTEFQKNAIIAATAAILAFIFSFILELIKQWVQTASAKKRNRNLALLSLKATQKILESIKSKYQDNDYFDFTYLDQLKEITRQQEPLRYSDAFFERTVDQSAYFNLISRLYLLTANMESVQRFEYAQPNGSAQNNAKFISKKKSELFGELNEVSQKLEDLTTTLES